MVDDATRIRKIAQGKRADGPFFKMEMTADNGGADGCEEI